MSTKQRQSQSQRVYHVHGDQHTSIFSALAQARGIFSYCGSSIYAENLAKAKAMISIQGKVISKQTPDCCGLDEVALPRLALGGMATQLYRTKQNIASFENRYMLIC